MNNTKFSLLGIWLLDSERKKNKSNFGEILEKLSLENHSKSRGGENVNSLTQSYKIFSDIHSYRCSLTIVAFIPLISECLHQSPCHRAISSFLLTSQQFYPTKDSSIIFDLILFPEITKPPNMSNFLAHFEKRYSIIITTSFLVVISPNPVFSRYLSPRPQTT